MGTTETRPFSFRHSFIFGIFGIFDAAAQFVRCVKDADDTPKYDQLHDFYKRREKP
jgi:hypothetical protein